ncbi:hypothetical protein DL89DRAFT_268310 [Linderina pennispora]|uniref:Uncharacterized protein n=1 Tax=Linderina pennispora TaxID=61395 RepID=A0A1Y1W4P5_9FUNG|nr:uncharacterized protein DL89DRAFT_268310 [Linderina pennispora]ORX68467.1 hypothetical protein DL89DRAFT_268310 [Linderina pennispora]
MDSNDGAHNVDVFNLESLVLITGPCSTLPDHCQRRRLPPGLVYHPVVEAAEGDEPLYIKNKLPLFEVIDEAPTAGENIDDSPAAAVLRRRRMRQQQQKQTALGADGQEEDTSDAHYQHLHRKPEYVEKRVRTREVELYQYARWQEESGRTPKLHANIDSCATPIAATPTVEHDESLLINETLKKLENAPTANMHKRQRIGMRKELASLLDSAGFQEARVRSGRASPAVGPPSTRSGSPQPGAGVEAEGANEGQVAGEGPAEGLLTSGERRLAHSTSIVLEQLLVQASRLPNIDPPMYHPSSSPPMQQSDDEQDVEADDESDIEQIQPCDFSLPHKLYAGLMKQRTGS